MTQQLHLWVLCQKNWKRGSKTYWYTHVHSSITHSDPKVETIQVSVNRRMHKQNVVCLYNAISLSNLKTEGNSDTCNNMDEPCKLKSQKDNSCTIPQFSLSFGILTIKKKEEKKD